MGFSGVIKQKGGYYLITQTPTIQDLANRKNLNNQHIFHPRGCKNTNIVMDCDTAPMQVIRDMKNLIDEEHDINGFDKEYLIKEVLPKIINKFGVTEIITDSPFKELNASLIIQNKDKAFFLGNVGTFRETNDIEFFTPDVSYLYAAFEGLEGLPVYEQIKIASYAYNEDMYGMRFPITVFDTVKNEFKFLSLTECCEAFNNYKNGGSK